MGKLKEIVDGWTHVIVKDAATEVEALQRAKICALCPYNKNNKCKKCGCPLIAKTRSKNSKCPEGKW